MLKIIVTSLRRHAFTVRMAIDAAAFVAAGLSFLYVDSELLVAVLLAVLLLGGEHVANRVYQGLSNR